MISLINKKIKPDKIAIIFNNKNYTYSDLSVRIKFFEKFILKKNILEKEIIIVSGNYSIDSIALFFALYNLRLFCWHLIF